MDKPIIPITRINKFFSRDDFELDQRMGREFFEGDNNFKVILFRVNREISEFDDLYGEATKNGIRFYPPIELRVMPLFESPENKAYNDDGSARYLQDGKLTFLIYDAQLIEENTDISYGDYIGYPVTETEVRYFSVANDGKKNYDNRHTMVGYKGYYRTVLCTPVDGSEFSAI